MTHAGRWALYLCILTAHCRGYDVDPVPPAGAGGAAGSSTPAGSGDSSQAGKQSTTQGGDGGTSGSSGSGSSRAPLDGADSEGGAGQGNGGNAVVSGSGGALAGGDAGEGGGGHGGSGDMPLSGAGGALAGGEAGDGGAGHGSGGDVVVSGAGGTPDAGDGGYGGSDGSAGGGGTGGQRPIWLPVVACGSEDVSDDYDFHGNIPSAHISPQSYDTCDKSYVVDLDGVDVATAGEDAILEARWGDAVPQDQAGCEDTWGGAVFYWRGGGRWHPFTDVVESVGTWMTGVGCVPPSVAHTGLDPGGTYRVAATMRQVSDNATRRIAFETYQVSR